MVGKNIRFALFAFKKNFKNAKCLKNSFMISIIGIFSNNLALLILWWYFAENIGNLNGWIKYDILGLYGFNVTAYGLVFTPFYGLFNLPSYISTANLDKYLLTPKNIIIKIATSDINISSIGDFIFGEICFILYAILIKLTIVKIFVALLIKLLICVIFFSFVLISMTVSFYFADGDSISTGLYRVLLTPSSYHGGAFQGLVRIIFTYIVPSLILGAIPVEIIKDCAINRLLHIFFISLFWLILSVLFFYKSLKKYESNNFLGFGIKS